ncbi:MAG: hypothetical protein ABEJ40_00275 [Haloarculaceae archaeon]
MPGYWPPGGKTLLLATGGPGGVRGAVSGRAAARFIPLGAVFALMDGICAYCGSDLAAYDPVCLCECGTDVTLGRFCNVSCLVAYADEEELTAGDACEWTPDDAGCC